jgi:phospholipase C
VIVSPWTAGGWVASQRFDHTSILQFLERFTGVAEPNLTAWRRQAFGDLTSAFRFQDVRTTFPSLPETASALVEAEREVATLPKPTLPGATRKSELVDVTVVSSWCIEVGDEEDGW